jgi:hypothetical protein
VVTLRRAAAAMSMRRQATVKRDYFPLHDVMFYLLLMPCFMYD